MSCSAGQSNSADSKVWSSIVAPDALKSSSVLTTYHWSQYWNRTAPRSRKSRAAASWPSLPARLFSASSTSCASSDFRSSSAAFLLEPCNGLSPLGPSQHLRASCAPRTTEKEQQCSWTQLTRTSRARSSPRSAGVNRRSSSSSTLDSLGTICGICRKCKKKKKNKKKGKKIKSKERSSRRHSSAVSRGSNDSKSSCSSKGHGGSSSSSSSSSSSKRRSRGKSRAAGRGSSAVSKFPSPLVAPNAPASLCFLLRYRCTWDTNPAVPRALPPLAACRNPAPPPALRLPVACRHPAPPRAPPLPVACRRPVFAPRRAAASWHSLPTRFSSASSTSCPSSDLRSSTSAFLLESCNRLTQLCPPKFKGTCRGENAWQRGARFSRSCQDLYSSRRVNRRCNENFQIVPPPEVKTRKETVRPQKVSKCFQLKQRYSEIVPPPEVETRKETVQPQKVSKSFQEKQRHSEIETPPKVETRKETVRPQKVSKSFQENQRHSDIETPPKVECRRKTVRPQKRSVRQAKKCSVCRRCGKEKRDSPESSGSSSSCGGTPCSSRVPSGSKPPCAASAQRRGRCPRRWSPPRRVACVRPPASRAIADTCTRRWRRSCYATDQLGGADRSWESLPSGFTSASGTPCSSRSAVCSGSRELSRMGPCRVHSVGPCDGRIPGPCDRANRSGNICKWILKYKCKKPIRGKRFSSGNKPKDGITTQKRQSATTRGSRSTYVGEDPDRNRRSTVAPDARRTSSLDPAPTGSASSSTSKSSMSSNSPRDSRIPRKETNYGATDPNGVSRSLSTSPASKPRAPSSSAGESQRPSKTKETKYSRSGGTLDAGTRPSTAVPPSKPKAPSWDSQCPRKVKERNDSRGRRTTGRGSRRPTEVGASCRCISRGSQSPRKTQKPKTSRRKNRASTTAPASKSSARIVTSRGIPGSGRTIKRHYCGATDPDGVSRPFTATPMPKPSAPSSASRNSNVYSQSRKSNKQNNSRMRHTPEGATGSYCTAPVCRRSERSKTRTKSGSTESRNRSYSSTRERQIPKASGASLSPDKPTPPQRASSSARGTKISSAQSPASNRSNVEQSSDYLRSMDSKSGSSRASADSKRPTSAPSARATLTPSQEKSGYDTDFNVFMLLSDRESATKRTFLASIVFDTAPEVLASNSHHGSENISLPSYDTKSRISRFSTPSQCSRSSNPTRKSSGEKSRAVGVLDGLVVPKKQDPVTPKYKSKVFKGRFFKASKHTLPPITRLTVVNREEMLKNELSSQLGGRGSNAATRKFRDGNAKKLISAVENSSLQEPSQFSGINPEELLNKDEQLNSTISSKNSGMSWIIKKLSSLYKSKCNEDGAGKP